MKAVMVEILDDKRSKRAHGGRKREFAKLLEEVLLKCFPTMEHALDKVAVLVAFGIARESRLPGSRGVKTQAARAKIA